MAGALLVLLAGCGPVGASPGESPAVTAGGEASPSPSVSFEPSRAATDAPGPDPSPAASPVAQETQEPERCREVPYDGPWRVDPLPPGSAVTVAVDELNVREGPCTSAKIRGSAERGRVLIVSNDPYGPVKANGYAWYFVLFAPNSYPFGTLPALPESPFPDGTDTSGGWIAAWDGATPYVTPMEPRCPATPDLENVVMMLPAERMACFDEPFVIEGTYGCGGCGGTGGPTVEPRWLADPFEFEQIRVSWRGQFGYRPVGLHFRPSGPEPPREGSIIRATVHVNDLAAVRCTFTWRLQDPEFAVPEPTAIAWCRERLVVDSYEVLGTDPDYEGG